MNEDRQHPAVAEYNQQAERLSGHSHACDSTSSTTAVEAKFVTPHDPVIETADGSRLPSVPLAEAHKLNSLKAQVGHLGSSERQVSGDSSTLQGKECPPSPSHKLHVKSPDPAAALSEATPPSRTNPLFPTLPLYGPSSLLRDLQCLTFRVSSSVLSLAFLGVIVLGSAFTSIPLAFRHIGIRMSGQNPYSRRPFHEEERKRKRNREAAAREWTRNRRRRSSQTQQDGNEDEADVGQHGGFVPTEGGKDPLVCDAAYYARRVGLDLEEYEVQTEDGFLIELWHVFDPREHAPRTAEERAHRGPDVFPADPIASMKESSSRTHEAGRKQKYPVLLMHGLLQSAGAYCTNDDDSLAFFLCKSGYDVWLGNNRCGFKPKHTLLSYKDPRMWAWNIRQMGVMDLPALISRVLSETGFEKLGLICHSQGTTETFVALAKGQRPDLGDKISVFCALAPAVYAGPLIGKMYFKFMRVISPGLFRIIFGIHAFIPFMMAMHAILPGRLYGALGYRVFSFLFNWTDDRWELDLRDRMFQFAPVYVSAESMRWWLGRECFARHKCILATKEEGRQEDAEDVDEESPERESPSRPKGDRSWYNEQTPPFALWIAGSDELVDGKRLLRRFEKGREPHVQVVHSKVIEEYEHLDVIWAINSIEKVGKEVREVIWKTAPQDAVDRCRVPTDCETARPDPIEVRLEIEEDLG